MDAALIQTPTQLPKIVMPSTRHPPADAAELLAFLMQVIHGEPIPAAQKKNAEVSEPVYPTLDQRLRAMTLLMSKLDAMQKQITDQANADTTFSFTAKDIEDMRAAMLGKLGGLAAARDKKRAPRKPRSGGSDSSVS
jgi:hypothetical protein